MGIITKSLLKFARSPKRVYSLIRKIAPQVIDFTLVDDENIAKDAIEKELLLSAFVLAYDPNKDMRSNFILDYIKEIEENFLSYNSSEDILDYCVNSGCGVCFDSKKMLTMKQKKPYTTILLHDWFFIEKLLPNCTTETISALIVFTMQYITGRLVYSDILWIKILTS